MSIPISQFIPTSLPPWYPYICSLCLCLYFCFANKFICIIFLDSTYKGYYMIFVFLQFTSLCMTVSRPIHNSANGTISFLFTLESHSIVCMYCIFFTHFLVNGHLGCFHVLTIVNNAAMNTGVHVSFWSIVFSRYMPRVGLLDHMVALYVLAFKDPPYCSP